MKNSIILRFRPLSSLNKIRKMDEGTFLAYLGQFLILFYFLGNIRLIDIFSEVNLEFVYSSCLRYQNQLKNQNLQNGYYC